MSDFEDFPEIIDDPDILETKPTYPKSKGWEYTMTTGHVITVVRWYDGEGKKHYKQLPGPAEIRKEFPDAKFRPLAGFDPAAEILIVEGEKCVDAARAFGLNATTWPGGAGGTKPCLEHTSWDEIPLTGPPITIWPDADEPGEKIALLLSGHLVSIGSSRVIKLVKVREDAPKGEDIADYQDRDAVLKLIENAVELPFGDLSDLGEKIKEKSAEAEPPEPEPPAFQEIDLKSEIEPQKFILENLIPAGEVTLLASSGGMGKSMLAMSIGLCIAAGKTWCHLDTVRGRVGFWSLEDSQKTVIQRARNIIEQYDIPDSAESNFQVFGSNRPAIHFYSGLGSSSAFQEFADLITAERYDFVVLDNASVVFTANENDRGMVTGFIAELSRIAAATDTAILLLSHLDKAAARDGGNHDQNFSGSTAWSNRVRSRLFLKAHESLDGRKVLVHEKSNLGPLHENVELERREAGVIHQWIDPYRNDPGMAILPYLKTFEREHGYIPGNLKHGSNSLQSKMQKEIESLDARYAEGKPGRERIVAAVRRMEDAGKLEILDAEDERGRSRKEIKILD